jgi:hypothetical protein
MKRWADDEEDVVEDPPREVGDGAEATLDGLEEEPKKKLKLDGFVFLVR